MLSILIPTYNYDCYDLVKELNQQVCQCNIKFEIIVIDDCSTLNIINNQKLNTLPHTQYIKLNNNIGRSKIRNLLADKAIYPYLLFMDCDAEVCSKHYISEYLKHCQPNCCIVGGTAYDPKENNPQYSLRLKYGRLREGNQTYTKRFTTFNFLIHKDLFNKVKFNESIRDYGHEDSLFGAQIKKISNITTINNPLIHKGLDTNDIFIKKTETAIYNLLKLSQSNIINDLLPESTILQTYKKLKKYHLTILINIAFCATKKCIQKQISSKNPSLFLFDCYKIGYLCHIASKKQ